MFCKFSSSYLYSEMGDLIDMIEIVIPPVQSDDDAETITRMAVQRLRRALPKNDWGQRIARNIDAITWHIHDFNPSKPIVWVCDHH